MSFIIGQKLEIPDHPYIDGRWTLYTAGVCRKGVGWMLASGTGLIELLVKGDL